MEDFDAAEIEAKWQSKWDDVDLFRPIGPEGGSGKKFFLIFAYPGVSGYLHVGHMRGFTYSDVITRYKRAAGYDVLFPVGFHATGIPAISLAKRIERKDEKTIDYLIKNGTPENIVDSLGDVDKLIDYFSHVYINDYWKRFGFGMDFTRCMSTISPGYKRFITWQFHQLHEKGLLTTKPHYAPYCPKCGPVAVDTSMTDISEGGNAEVQEFTALKFRLMDGTVLPAATLRPETVFGVTNMWLHPDVEYVKAKVMYETWILSREAFDKLKHQMEGVAEIEELGTVPGTDLIGGTCRTPVGAEVPILPGRFVDPNVATGVVMSVPAHAPFDWVALKDVQKDLGSGSNPFELDVEKVLSLEPITLIKSGKEETADPAGKLCIEMGIESQDENEKLEEATRRIYKEEFHSGTLLSICGEYSGLRVSQIKDTLRIDFIDQGLADRFFEFSEKVICRCGTQVVISRIPDQWFIEYSDPEWTERSKEHAAVMNLSPEEFGRDLPAVLDWFGDRACIRRGSWLGTEFPYKKDWIIEPISDSTLYPAYYIISKYVNEGSLRIDWMDDDFFSYVFLGEGSIDDLKPDRKKLYEKIRRDFLYWYPLDINLGGKEHKTVHFPVFLMNHVALLKKEHWPRGIYVHWWVTMGGGDKISKTKGGAEPIPEAILKYGVDAMRLYYCHVGSSNMDVEWQEEIVSHYKARIKRVYDQIRELLEIPDEGPSDIDIWLRSRMMMRVREITNQLEAGHLRDASNVEFFTITSDLKWYLRRGGSSREVIGWAMSLWTRMLQPFTPHLAEETWEKMGMDGFVSTAPWPEFDGSLVDGAALKKEDYVIDLLEDLKRIRKMTDIEPKRIILYTASDWKWKVLRHLMDMVSTGDGRLDPESAIKSLMADPEMREQGKAVPKLVGRLTKDVVKMGDQEKARYAVLEDEMSILTSLSGFLSEEMGSDVSIFSEDDPKKDDPVGKSRGAIPLKPAIFME
ncbi:MAG: leucine--tRNA ligase [Thermoplasmatota archaeon]